MPNHINTFLLKKFIFSFFILLSIFALVHPAEAGFSTPPSKRFTLDDIKNIFMDIIYWGWKIFAALAIIMFICAGAMFLTAAGNESQISTAKKWAIWATVGILVGILGFSIEAIIRNVLGVK